MITIAWYLLKVMICSGILCGYYFLALRNKIFHRWNRFFLLASVILALVVPVMKINIFQNPDENKGTVIKMLQTINYGDEVVIEYGRKGFHINSELITVSAYLLISAILLIIFFIALYKIIRLKKKYPETQIEGIHFITTDAKGTPFSFFNSIFWNKAIDLHSKPGQQIFNHEIAHIKEKHSYDKTFMNIILIFFWINPFFWLMRKELNMIHEFIADQKALEDSDINAFAEMILQTVYPTQKFSLVNNFFYSPLKRRLLMLTKNKNPKVSYLSRLLVLPLAAIVFFAFTLKVNKVNEPMNYNGKTITVVIDAGHGGEDNGATLPTGLMEKSLTLSIAKKVAALNSNEHIKILLSRDNDKNISVKGRVDYAKTNGANLFISLHLDASTTNDKSGISVLIDKNNKDILLASALINELKKSYKTEDKIGIRTNGGIWVLDKNVCPAAIVECGYLTNPGDEAFITNNANQEKIAKNILAAINNYASINKTPSVIKVEEDNTSPLASVKNDTIPPMYYKNKKVATINIVPATPKVEVAYNDGTHETITMEQAKKRGFIVPPPPPPPAPNTAPPPPAPLSPNRPVPPPPPPLPPDAVYILNGKISTIAEVKAIDPNNIQIVNVLKGEKAITKYGEKGRKGVIEITTNSNGYLQNDTTPRRVFTKVENEAVFPGGREAWLKYVISQIKKNQEKLTEKDFGTCVLKFIVNTDGSVSNTEATTMKGSQLAKIAVEAIRKGPKWIPATQNGKIVTAYRLQPVTLTDPYK